MKEFPRDVELPWDFINVGINKQWLVDEYNKAFEQTNSTEIQPTCEHKCVQCGVCPNLGVHKVLDKKFVAKNYVKPEQIHYDPRTAPTITTYKYRLKVTKLGILRYFHTLIGKIPS